MNCKDLFVKIYLEIFVTLSVQDKKLITWNLVKARPAFITNIKVSSDRFILI